MYKPTPETKLKDWYILSYPRDDLGKMIDPEATFQGLFDTLDCYQDVYAYIGISDSIIREHLFDGLASCIDADYSYIYDQWLRGAKQ